LYRETAFCARPAGLIGAAHRRPAYADRRYRKVPVGPWPIARVTRGRTRRRLGRLCRETTLRAGDILAAVGATGTITLFEGDRRQVQRNEEVFEEVLDDANLVVQAVVAFEQM